jgi:hypothetical protein
MRKTFPPREIRWSFSSLKQDRTSFIRNTFSNNVYGVSSICTIYLEFRISPRVFFAKKKEAVDLVADYHLFSRYSLTSLHVSLHVVLSSWSTCYSIHREPSCFASIPVFILLAVTFVPPIILLFTLLPFLLKLTEPKGTC